MYRALASVVPLATLLACAPGAEDAVLEARHDAPELCARKGDDRVRDLFCAESPPNVRSLVELRTALGLEADTTEHVFLAHSTALSGQIVSAINPRMIALTPDLQLAFHRGVQQVELTARDRQSQRIKLYLLRFEQACNAAAHGCGPGELYTRSIESSWTQLSLRDDEDLKNTAFDCRQCHQRALEEPILLMRELEGPWTHFFGPEAEASTFPEPAASDLFQDYVRAKGDEAYGGVTTEHMRTTSGFALQAAVNDKQPVIFEGAIIANERWPWSSQGYASEPQRSPTWDAQFAAFKRGEHLALPYYATRATDPDKLAQLSAAYQAAEQPDLSDIHPDDPRTRAEIGLQTEPDATPVELLIQACAPCHNDILDPTISRARFTIALGRIDAAERELAAERIMLPAEAHGVMPPHDARQLDESGRQRLLEYLQRSTRPSADEAQLAHAAALGMALAPEERAQ